ncbi:proteasome subunit beta [Klenkia terrae]
MSDQIAGRSGFTPAYLDRVGSSFTDFLGTVAPDLLPGRRPVPAVPMGDMAPHGTTIVAATFDGGVLMGGDRRATMGNLISSRDIEKVYAADSWSVIGIAGAAGIAIEMVRLYQVELEHYEKIEGMVLSLDGKANRLAAMIRGNLGAAMQGLAVVPLFAGYDLDAAEGVSPGRIFSYDVTGGNYDRLAVRPQLAEEDLAARAVRRRRHPQPRRGTGGPDSVRRLYPILYRIDAEGAVRLTDDEVAEIAASITADRSAGAANREA